MNKIIESFVSAFVAFRKRISIKKDEIIYNSYEIICLFALIVVFVTGIFLHIYKNISIFPILIISFIIFTAVFFIANIHVRFEKNTFKTFVFIVVFLILAIQIIGMIHNIPKQIDDFREIAIYSSDERTIGQKVFSNIKNDTLDPNRVYSYGYFYHSVAFYMIKIFHFLGYDKHEEVPFVALSLRLVSFVSYLLLLFLVYKFVKKITKDDFISILSVLFTASIYKLNMWGQMIHPDILAAMLLVLSSFVAFYKHNFYYAISAAFIAGVSFGTKYTSIFFLPFIGLPSSIEYIIKNKTSRFWKKPFVVIPLLMCILAFVVGWLVFNPTVLSNWKYFKYYINYEQHHLATGHGVVEPKNPMLWFPVLLSMFRQSGSIIIIIGVIAVMIYLAVIVRKKQIHEKIIRKEYLEIFTLFLYVVMAFVYLMLRVRMREERFFFHILPFLIIIAFFGLGNIKKILRYKWLQIILVTLMLIAIMPNNIKTIRQTKFLNNKSGNPNLKAGKYIEDKFSKDICIFYYTYSYIPLKFTNVHELAMKGLRLEQIFEHKPDLIMLNASLPGRWLWKKRDSKMKDHDFVKGNVDNPEDYEETKKTFEFLLSENSPYEIFYENPGAVVLKKKDDVDLDSYFKNMDTSAIKK